MPLIINRKATTSTNQLVSWRTMKTRICSRTIQESCQMNTTLLIDRFMHELIWVILGSSRWWVNHSETLLVGELFLQWLISVSWSLHDPGTANGGFAISRGVGNNPMKAADLAPWTLWSHPQMVSLLKRSGLGFFLQWYPSMAQGPAIFLLETRLTGPYPHWLSWTTRVHYELFNCQSNQPLEHRHQWNSLSNGSLTWPSNESPK